MVSRPEMQLRAVSGFVALLHPGSVLMSKILLPVKGMCLSEIWANT